MSEEEQKLRDEWRKNWLEKQTATPKRRTELEIANRRINARLIYLESSTSGMLPK